jgi:hypothetical protein
VALEPLADVQVPVVVTVARARYRPGMTARLQVTAGGEERLLEARILGPLGGTR